MKVLFVNPPNQPYSSPDLLIEPIDILAVASYTQSLEHEVKVVDMDIKQREAATIEDELKSFNPDFTVIPYDYHIPLFTSDAIPGVNTIARLANEHGSRVVIGGRSPNHFPEQFLDSVEGVIIVGEMEPALKELLEGSAISSIDGIIYKTNGVIQRTNRREGRFDLNKLPIPNRSLVDVNDYIDVRSLLSSRGCVENCGFCPVPEFWGNWKYRNPDKVVDEIEYLVEEYGAQKVLFLDDHATVNRRRLQQISEGILERGIETTLGCLGTVSRYDPETVKKMQKAGFRWIHYGGEMVSQRVLDYMRKRITPEQIKEAVIGTKQAGLRVRTSWIFDSPKANEEDLDRTIDFILETQPEEIRAHYLTLRAGTPFTREVERRMNGFKVIPPQYIHNGTPHSSFDTVNPEIIVEKVSYLVSELQRMGYLVVRDTQDWKRFNDPAIGTPDTKIISFCPLRYGIGWQR